MRKKIQFRAVFGLYALYEKLCEDDKNIALAAKVETEQMNEQACESLIDFAKYSSLNQI